MSDVDCGLESVQEQGATSRRVAIVSIVAATRTKVTPTRETDDEVHLAHWLGTPLAVEDGDTCAPPATLAHTRGTWQIDGGPANGPMPTVQEQGHSWGRATIARARKPQLTVKKRGGLPGVGGKLPTWPTLEAPQRASIRRRSAYVRPGSGSKRVAAEPGARPDCGARRELNGPAKSEAVTPERIDARTHVAFQGCEPLVRERPLRVRMTRRSPSAPIARCGWLLRSRVGRLRDRVHRGTPGTRNGSGTPRIRRRQASQKPRGRGAFGPGCSLEMVPVAQVADDSSRPRARRPRNEETRVRYVEVLGHRIFRHWPAREAGVVWRQNANTAEQTSAAYMAVSKMRSAEPAPASRAVLFRQVSAAILLARLGGRLHPAERRRGVPVRPPLCPSTTRTARARPPSLPLSRSAHGQRPSGTRSNRPRLRRGAREPLRHRSSPCAREG